MALFDAIHSVDRPSLCEALAKEIAKQGRPPLLFVEINTGAEPQKAGVLPQDADAFLARCRDDLWPDDRRADVHSAGRRGAGAAFRADRQDRGAQRPEAAVDGHERGLRDRDRLRRDPCAGRQRDFRRANRRREQLNLDRVRGAMPPKQPAKVASRECHASRGRPAVWPSHVDEHALPRSATRGRAL